MCGGPFPPLISRMSLGASPYLPIILRARSDWSFWNRVIWLGILRRSSKSRVFSSSLNRFLSVSRKSKNCNTPDGISGVLLPLLTHDAVLDRQPRTGGGGGCLHASTAFLSAIDSPPPDPPVRGWPSSPALPETR